MSTVTATKPWDFSQALELLNTNLSGPAPSHHSTTAPAGWPATCHSAHWLDENQWQSKTRAVQTALDGNENFTHNGE
jgi:hypothetical protein